MAKALNIAAVREYRVFTDHSEVNRPPLFATLLALVYKYVDISVRSSFWVSKAFGLVNVLVLYFMGEKLFGRWVGFIAVMVMLSSDYFNDYLFARVLVDSPQAAFLNLSMLYLALGFEREKVLHFAVAACSLANGFLVKESAIWWLALPLVAFMLINSYRTRRNLVGLALFYLCFSLLVSWWWLYVYIETDGAIYLVNTGKYQALDRLVPFVPLLFPLPLILFYAIRRQKVLLALWHEYETGLSLVCKALGLVFLALFIGIAADPFAIERLQHYWISRLLPVVRQNKVFYFFVPSWMFFAWLLARRRSGITALSVIYLVMNIPLFTVMVKYYLRPQSMWAFFVFCCLPIAVVVTDSVKGVWRFANNLSGGYSWAIRVFTSILILGGAVVAVRSSLSFSSALPESSYSSLAGRRNIECAAWVRRNIEPNSGILLDSLHDGTFYFLMQGPGYRVHRSPVLRSAFLFTSEAHFLTDDRKIYVDAKDETRSGAGTGVYEFLSERAFFDTVIEEEIDYVVYGSQEGTFGSPPSLDVYFENHSAYQLLCRAGSLSRGRVSVYKVDRDMLHSSETTYIDSGSLSRALASGEASSYSNYEIVSGIGSEIDLWLEDPDEVGYLELGDIYLRAGMLHPALDNYRRFLKMNVNEPLVALENQEVSPAISTAILHTLGEEYWTALAAYREVIEKNPQMVAVRIGTGDSYRALGRVADAEKAYLQAISIDPQHLEANYKLGDLYREGKEYERAIRRYAIAARRTEAIYIERRLSMTWGDYLQSLGDLDQAIAYYREAVHYPYTLLDRNVSEQEVDSLLQSVPTSAESSSVGVSAFFIDAPKLVLFQHPSSSLSYRYAVSGSARLEFSLALSPEVWYPTKGDGVQFDIYISDRERKWRVYSRYIDPKNIPDHRGWHNHAINLSPWAGETVTVTLETGCGPHNDCNYDWAGWGNPRIVQPIAYDFLAELRNANHMPEEGTQIRQDVLTIDYESRSVVFEHPPGRVAYELDIPFQAGLHFGLGMAPSVWSPDKGDGVEYNVYVRHPDDPNILDRLFHKYIDPKNNPDDRHWQDEVVDLSNYAGERVEIVFETLPGPDGDASFDWAGWSNPVLVAGDMALSFAKGLE